MNSDKRVEHILDKYPETRDRDEILVMKYWNDYYDVGITKQQARKILESECITTIIRQRSFIQNEEGRFLPSEGARTARKKKQARFQYDYSPNKNFKGEVDDRREPPEDLQSSEEIIEKIKRENPKKSTNLFDM